jgi:hypothetical protein
MIMTERLIRGTETKLLAKNLAIAAGLFGVGLLLDHYTILYAGAMTGAGHGIFIPVVYTCPRPWIVLCPFLITTANCIWPMVRIFAKSIVCLYYVWLFFHLRDLSNLLGEYNRIADRNASDFWIWAGLVLLTHILIWLPVPLIRSLKTARQALTNDLKLQSR